MFEIDKKKLGAFILELRKEKGYTQKELAEQLYISDKAISKWEHGVSIPDTTLLIPLAELLGVTVTELLMYQRIEPAASINTDKVEDIIKTAITYTDTEQTNNTGSKKQWCMAYILCLLICFIELIYTKLYFDHDLLIIVIITAIMGGYFCLFAKEKLPVYYDENHINIFSDGILRMHIPGIALNNTNWPHIIHVIRIWTVIALASLPLLTAIIYDFFSETIWHQGFTTLILLFVAGFVIPIYIVGKKYQ